MAYRWDFAPLIDSADVLLVGLAHTLALFTTCCIASLVIGLLAGLAKRARRWWLRAPAIAFVAFFRNTPALVLILWIYFALPVLVPVSIDPAMAAALGISLSSAAFVAEIFRGGIQSIERGQWEGALAVGMTRPQAMGRVILPQATRRMLPALTNRGIETFKMTTLASIVAYPELLQQAKLVASVNFNPIESYTAVALAFFVCLVPLVNLTYLLERRLARSDR
jgi:polar amino acid transport system permease protein